MLFVLASGCERIDSLRFAHANGGTTVEWPPGAPFVELEIQVSTDGRLWLPVSVDDNFPVPFLLQASAGAIALTGARAAGFGPVAAGSLTLRDELLPGIRGGLLIKQRQLVLGALKLDDQSLLLVESANWPHGQPRGGAAGVLGYDLFRRFVVELDARGHRLLLYRRSGVDVGRRYEVQRLAVLDRVPYFEAWLEPAVGTGRWVRLQFEPAEPVGVCLDDDSGPGVVKIARREITVAAGRCPPAAGERRKAARDGIFGAAALQSLLVTVDYEAGRIGFEPRN